MSGPLNGIRVLDMGAFGVGPRACGMLGLMGAEVIRIEPDYGDGLMRVAPFIKGVGATYLAPHHNSRNIVLGLKDEKVKEIAYKLVQKSDIVIENRRVGALDRLGFGYEKVSKINPRIIYVSSAAYGHTGPFLRFGGADHYLQAMSGFASLNGRLDGQAELLRYVALVDGTGSITIVQACLMALVQRDKTGKGQYIDTDEFSASLFLQSTRIAEYFATGQEPRRMGSECSKVCPSKAYLTQDNQYILISALTHTQWLNLCTALKLNELADDGRFSSNEARLQRREEVNQIIQEKVRDRPLVWWLWHLAKCGVPNSKVMNVEDLMEDRHVIENKYIVDRPSSWGILKYPNVPWKFHETPLNEMRASPAVDADRDYVLSLIE